MICDAGALCSPLSNQYIQTHIGTERAIDIAYLGANQHRFHKFQEVAMSSNVGYYELSPKNYYFTYGTFAIGLSRLALEAIRDHLRSNLDISTYPADIMMWDIVKRNSLHTRVLFPFLVIPDVADSDTGVSRNQSSFCDIRRCNVSHYNFISHSQINRLRELIEADGLVLPSVFAGTNLSRSSVHQLSSQHMQPEAAALMSSVAVFLTPGGTDASRVDIRDLLHLVRGARGSMRI